MLTPYETYNNQVGVRLSYLLKDEQLRCDNSLQLFSYDAYEKRAIRHTNIKLRAGLGKGNEVLINWKYIEQREPEWKELLVSTFGDPVVEHNPMEEHFVMDGKAQVWFAGYLQADGTHLSPEKQQQYVINASTWAAFVRLKKARTTMHKAKGNGVQGNGLWCGLMADLIAFKSVLKTKFGCEHTLPTSERRIRPYFSGFAEFNYEWFIDDRGKQRNAAKIATDKQQATIEMLLRKNNNYNNEQVAEFYNMMATTLGWKQITASAVAEHRKALGLWITDGNSGTDLWYDTKAMQNKRRPPSKSMVYWTMDGWDVELLYQQDETNAKGHKVTTYHNRLTVVVVLDPVAGIKYPIGYAIGTHETPALISEALRNAANHTAELFGSRHKPLQLQSDRYSLKALTPIYEAMSSHFTPAKVGNKKAKVIEPYFSYLNKQAQKYFPNNWSGHNVDARKENQPNQQWMDKVGKKHLPDEAGCRAQIERLIQIERDAKIVEYMQRWDELPNDDRLPLPAADYLYLFGQTHSHTNRLQGQGLTPTLLGETMVYDTFDARFREHGYMDWVVKYDPSDLSEVLVLNAKADANRKVLEVVGTHRFLLQQKYIQPMALYDRQEGDAAQLAAVSEFNRQLEASVVSRTIQQQQLVEELFVEHPKLNDTLAKMVLTDSTGQHKDQRNKQRALKAKKQVIHLPPAPIETYEIDEDVRNNY